MNTSYVKINFKDEILHAEVSIKKGLLEFSKYNPSNVGLHIPFLLTSMGLEKILKVLYYLEYQRRNNMNPPMKYLDYFQHDLNKLLKVFVDVLEANKDDETTNIDPSDLEFLKENADFKKMMDLLSDFSITSKYYNLHDSVKVLSYEKNPDNFLLLFKDELTKRYPDLEEEYENLPITNPETYLKVALYIEELVDTFMLIVTKSLKNGVFGAKAIGIYQEILNEMNKSKSRINIIDVEDDDDVFNK